MNIAAEFLAASSKGALWILAVAVIVAVLLLGAVLLGIRKSRSRRLSTPPPGAEARRGPQAQAGVGWQTPEDNPENHTHRR
ncbi:hypothetical protein ACFWN1_09130 [Streptomyces sp. NPDC058459]|uniref:hypothetical protein n=1 Tax=Streptomyces sp. NPDC058459 TaxID=3346508 RepID=UPI00365AB0BE